MSVTLADIQKLYGDDVYPPYKGVEPFMENDNGIGYKGVVLYNQVEDKIQCNECREWYAYLGLHTFQSHNMKAEKYKEKYGLLMKTPLCTPKISAKLSKSMSDVNRRSPLLGKRGGDRLKRLAKMGELKHKTNSLSRMEAKNINGLCPAQIAQRIFIIKEELGKKSIGDLTTGEIRKQDEALYKAIQVKYKSIKNAEIELGLKKKDGNKIEDAEVIAKLRNFVRKYKRLPVQKYLSPKNGLVTPSVLYRIFGSTSRALFLSGVYQLLEELGVKKY